MFRAILTEYDPLITNKTHQFCVVFFGDNFELHLEGGLTDSLKGKFISVFPLEIGNDSRISWAELEKKLKKLVFTWDNDKLVTIPKKEVDKILNL